MSPEEVLAYCLQEIESGRKTITECVAMVPDAPELEAQLLAVQALKKWPTPVMRPAASQRLEANLRRQVWAQTRARTNLFARASQKFTPAMRWAIMAAVLFALFFASAGTVAASASSTPGELLYPLKRAGEAVGLALTRPEDRAAYHVKLAKNRLDELSILIARGNADPTSINSLNLEIITETETAISAVNQASADARPQLWQEILAETERQQSTLQTLKDRVPPQAQATLESTLDESAQHSTLAREAVENTTGDLPTATASATPPSASASPTLAPSQPSSVVISPTGITATPPPTSPNANSPASTSTHPDSDQPTSSGPQHTKAASTHTSPAPTHTLPAFNTQATPPANTNAAPTADNGLGGGGDSPNCHANNPNSPNYCTPTPQPTAAATDPSAASTSAPVDSPTPTACPTNPGGQPKCK